MVSSFKFKLDISDFPTPEKMKFPSWEISRLENFPIPDIKKNFPDFENPNLHWTRYQIYYPKNMTIGGW